jgi:5'-methylthioadenosine phosphorylase
LSRVKIGIIGGTGLERFLEKPKRARIKTPYGSSPHISIGILDGHCVAFLPRHGSKHETPPHKINYRANVWSLKKLGVERVISTNAVGAINERYKPGDIVVPSDIIDFTKTRLTTFYDAAPVVHIDVTNPYCPQLRESLSDSTKKQNQTYWDGSVLAATEGPRFETPAEIKMMRILGCDIVGMTGSPEVFLARELEICYAAICFVSNMAAGIQNRLTTEEVTSMAKNRTSILLEVIKNVINEIPKKKTCSCFEALKDAKM